MDGTIDTPLQDAARKASEKAVDDDALLDGEDPRTRHPDDVEHWLAAYSELISFKEGLLAKGRSEIAEMDNPNSRKEAAEVDMTLLTTELDRFRRRLEFWQRRNEELEAGRA